MKPRFRFPTVLLLFIVAFLSVIISGGLSFIPNRFPAIAAHTTLSAARTKQVQPTLTQDITAFGLTVASAPLIPDGLGQSDYPNESIRGIIGLADNRIPLTSNNYPWSAIGRVDGVTVENLHYTCTGSLIASDVVLTNAHCVVDPETHELSKTILFQPNLVGGQLKDDADVGNVTTVMYGTDFRDNSSPPNADDWAFLKLDKPIGEKYGTLGWSTLSVSSLARDYQEKLMLVGYSGDFPADAPAETAGVQQGCSVLGELDDSLLHDCDTFGGASGGPILSQIDDEFRIVALNSAERVEEAREPGATEPTARAGIVNYAVRIERIVDFINQPATP